MQQINVVAASRADMTTLVEGLATNYYVENSEILGIANKKEKGDLFADGFGFTLQAFGDNVALSGKGGVFAFERMLGNAPSGEYGIGCAHGDKREPGIVSYGYELTRKYKPSTALVDRMREVYRFASEEDFREVITAEGMTYYDGDYYIDVLMPVLEALATDLPEVKIETVDWEDKSLSLSEAGSSEFVYSRIF